jgi:m7GpppX diphosphatase
MEKTIEKMKYKFIPNEVIEFSNIQITKLLLTNDVFEKYEAKTEVKGEYIICNDITKLNKNNKKIIKESFEDYLKFISNREKEKDAWIYNIINGLSEQENILHRDIASIVVPSYTWDSKNIQKLHILCIPTDTSLRTIRDLTSDNIQLLEHMKKVTLFKIEEKYKLKEENLKIFLHYEPSTYHLHIHFINLLYEESNSSVEYSHDLDSVIFNLKMESNYYKKIKMNRRI